MRAGRSLVVSFLALAVIVGSAVLPGRGPRSVSSIPVSATLGTSVEAAREQVRLNPADASARARLGLAFLAQVKANADPSFYPKAQAEFERALAVDESHFEALFGMATLSLGRHDFRGGLEWGRKAHRANPYNADALGAIGDGLLESGRYSAAGRAFQRMVDLRPGLPAFARISYLRELRGDIEGALEAMQRARRAAGSAVDAAWCFFHIGDLHLNSGDIASARKAYRSAARLTPDGPGALHGLAKLASATGHPERAVDLMKRVIRLSAEPGYAIYLGDLHSSLDQPEAAADAYALAKKLDGAEEANAVNVNLEASLFAADHGLESEALERAATEYASRRSVHVADAYAWALYSKGRIRAAERLSREAFRLGTRSPLFYFHAGMIDAALGRKSQAVKELRTALALNPSFSLLHAPTARKVLVRLQEKR